MINIVQLNDTQNFQTEPREVLLKNSGRGLGKRCIKAGVDGI